MEEAGAVTSVGQWRSRGCESVCSGACALCANNWASFVSFGSGDSHVPLPGNTFWHALRSAKEKQMSYRIAAVDVHKKMLAVVVADIAGEGEFQFERRKFGATPGELHVLAQWLDQQEVEEVVMESTAQYWKPVWGMLERFWK